MLLSLSGVMCGECLGSMVSEGDFSVVVIIIIVIVIVIVVIIVIIVVGIIITVCWVEGFGMLGLCASMFLNARLGALKIAAHWHAILLAILLQMALRLRLIDCC